MMGGGGWGVWGITDAGGCSFLQGGFEGEREWRGRGCSRMEDEEKGVRRLWGRGM